MRADLTVGRPWVARQMQPGFPATPWEVVGVGMTGGGEVVVATHLSQKDAEVIARAGNEDGPRPFVSDAHP